MVYYDIVSNKKSNMIELKSLLINILYLYVLTINIIMDQDGRVHHKFLLLKKRYIVFVFFKLIKYCIKHKSLYFIKKYKPKGRRMIPLDGWSAIDLKSIGRLGIAANKIGDK